MLARFRPRLNHATVVAYLALFLALGGGALAATGFIGADGRIHGCVGKTGQLTLAKPGAKCGKSLTAIAWNQRGPRGLTGARGPRGFMGAQGIPGPTFAASSTANSSSNPPPNPDESASGAAGAGRSFNFTLPSAGNVYIRFFSPFMGRDCVPGSSYGGIYLDGAPVAASQHVMENTAADKAAEFVAVTPAAAGAHQVQVREDCPNGNLGNTLDAVEPTWTVLLVGG